MAPCSTGRKCFSGTRSNPHPHDVDVKACCASPSLLKSAYRPTGEEVLSSEYTGRDLLL